MFDLSGKTALVTGGSRGIGRAAAEFLAKQGARVILTFSRGSEAAEQVVQAIGAAGGQAQAEQLDITDFEKTETAVEAIIKRAGRLDILVANAGVSIDALMLRVKESDLDNLLAVNVKGSLGCARAALKPMMKARSGRIIFVSSVIGQTGNAGQVMYAATKAALFGITKSLAREYASRNVTVNAVAPGYVDTDMTRALTEAQREAAAKGIPFGRAAQPAEVASAIGFLASSEASYITGHVLAVNGGMYM